MQQHHPAHATLYGLRLPEVLLTQAQTTTKNLDSHVLSHCNNSANSMSTDGSKDYNCHNRWSEGFLAAWLWFW